MVIELSGVQFSLKSYARFQNREIDFTTRSSIATLLQPLWNRIIHFAVPIYIYIYSQYLKAFTSHFVCIQKWYDKDRKWCDLRQRDTQRRFPPKYNANIFKTIQSTFRSLEMHSTGCFKSSFRFFIRLNFTYYLKKPFLKLSMLFTIYLTLNN